MLIIKRKYVNAINDPESLATVVDQVGQNVQDNISYTPNVVTRLTVLRRLKIPVGTDMYD